MGYLVPYLFVSFRGVKLPNWSFQKKTLQNLQRSFEAPMPLMQLDAVGAMDGAKAKLRGRLVRSFLGG